jgi:DNA polymerase-4
VGVTKFFINKYYQEILFDFEKNKKQRRLDKTLDDLRKRDMAKNVLLDQHFCIQE